MRFGYVVGEKDVILTRQRSEHVGRGQHLIAVFGEFEIGDHLRMQKAHQIAEYREFEAGHDLFGHRRAADHMAALEHERLQPGAGEVGAAGQPIVAAPDDDGVVPLRHARELLTTFIALKF